MAGRPTDARPYAVRGADRGDAPRSSTRARPAATSRRGPDGTILRVNQTFLTWTGHRREDLVGRTRFPELLSPGGRIYHETHYAPLLRMQGAVREIAVEVVCADGAPLPALINSVMHKDADGQPRVSAPPSSTPPTARSTRRSSSRARRAEQAADWVSAIEQVVASTWPLCRGPRR